MTFGPHTGNSSLADPSLLIVGVTNSSPALGIFTHHPQFRPGLDCGQRLSTDNAIKLILILLVHRHPSSVEQQIYMYPPKPIHPCCHNADGHGSAAPVGAPSRSTSRHRLREAFDGPLWSWAPRKSGRPFVVHPRLQGSKASKMDTFQS